MDNEHNDFKIGDTVSVFNDRKNIYEKSFILRISYEVIFDKCFVFLPSNLNTNSSSIMWKDKKYIKNSVIRF